MNAVLLCDIPQIRLFMFSACDSAGEETLFNNQYEYSFSLVQYNGAHDGLSPGWRPEWSRKSPFRTETIWRRVLMWAMKLFYIKMLYKWIKLLKIQLQPPHPSGLDRQDEKSSKYFGSETFAAARWDRSCGVQGGSEPAVPCVSLRLLWQPVSAVGSLHSYLMFNTASLPWWDTTPSQSGPLCCTVFTPRSINTVWMQVKDTHLFIAMAGISHNGALPEVINLLMLSFQCLDYRKHQWHICNSLKALFQSYEQFGSKISSEAANLTFQWQVAGVQGVVDGTKIRISLAVCVCEFCLMSDCCWVYKAYSVAPNSKMIKFPALQFTALPRSFKPELLLMFTEVEVPDKSFPEVWHAGFTAERLTSPDNV